MKIERRYIFEDLNSFVDGRFTQLRDDEERFWNQVIGTSEMVFKVTSSRAKLEMVYNRLIKLKTLQNWTDLGLDHIEKNLIVWGKNLDDFDGKCECDCTAVLQDPFRTSICELVERISTILTHYQDTLENIPGNLLNTFGRVEKEPVFLAFDVIERNVILLEKLYLHIQKLQNQVDFNDYFIRNTMLRCNNFY